MKNIALHCIKNWRKKLVSFYEELADVLEVVYALAPLIAGSIEELEQVRIAKKTYRGGFDKKIFVEKIHEN
jgi:predicted house-cleaning noncanonical NTP pyrophosphatase (MazG superfamily)